MNEVAMPKRVEVMTQSGALVDLYQPKSETISIRDIAAGLSRIARCAGQTIVDYSVAEHSLVVARILEAQKQTPLVCLFGLLHDAHEAFIGDLTGPAAAAIRAMGNPLREIDVMKLRIDQAIRSALGLRAPTPAALALIRYADEQALATEARDVMARPFTYEGAPASARFVIKPLGNATKAETAFLEEFQRLGVLAGIPNVLDVEL